MALQPLHSYMFWRDSTNLSQYSQSLKQFIIKLITSMIFSIHVHCTSHCATSRHVAGSIPVGVIGIFHWHNPSGHTVALVSTQPLTEMNTRDISLGVKEDGADKITTFMSRLSRNLGASNSWNRQGQNLQVCNGIHLQFTFYANTNIMWGLYVGFLIYCRRYVWHIITHFFVCFWRESPHWARVFYSQGY